MVRALPTFIQGGRRCASTRSMKPPLSAKWSVLCIILGLALIIREIRTSTMCVVQPKHGHSAFIPDERVPLPRFLADYLQPESSQLVSMEEKKLYESTPREIRWARADTANERVLSVSRNAIHAEALHRLFVFPRLGAVFCPVPGVASRAIISALARAEGITPERLPRLSEYAPRDRERFLSRPEITRILFVRHPYARILSAFYAGRRWVDEHGLEHPSYREFTGRVRGHPLAVDDHELEPMPLSFFLTFLSMQERSLLWEPFRPVSDLCGLGLLKYDFVGRMEHLEHHLHSLEHKLDAVLHPLTPSLISSNASTSVKEVFSTKIRRNKAAKLYKTDLELLGYNANV